MRTTMLPGRVSHGVPEALPTVRPKLQSAGMRGRNAVLCQAATIQRGVSSSPPSFILPPKWVGVLQPERPTHSTRAQLTTQTVCSLRQPQRNFYVLQAASGLSVVNIANLIYR